MLFLCSHAIRLNCIAPYQQQNIHLCAPRLETIAHAHLTLCDMLRARRAQRTVCVICERSPRAYVTLSGFVCVNVQAPLVYYVLCATHAHRAHTHTPINIQIVLVHILAVVYKTRNDRFSFNRTICNILFEGRCAVFLWIFVDYTSPKNFT